MEIRPTNNDPLEAIQEDLHDIRANHIDHLETDMAKCQNDIEWIKDFLRNWLWKIVFGGAVLSGGGAAASEWLI